MLESGAGERQMEEESMTRVVLMGSAEFSVPSLLALMMTHDGRGLAPGLSLGRLAF